MRAGLGFSLGVSSLFVFALASPTFAAERAVPNGAGNWMALDQCAAYGPGFTSLESARGCVKIGGHLRVEFGGVTYYRYTSRVAGAATAEVRTDNLASGTSDLAEPRHLRVRTDESYGYDPFVEPTSSATRTAQ
jgi:hypothetical protein